mgnify:CR=1 FL=1
MIFIATDHAGFALKQKIIEFLKKNGRLVNDLGPEKLDPVDDYSDFAFKLAQKVASQPESFGILLCRSGIGMSIVANKVKGVRAALCLLEEQAQKAREHNDANVLVLAADFTKLTAMEKIIDKFLTTEFSQEERHVRRLKKIAEFADPPSVRSDRTFGEAKGG